MYSSLFIRPSTCSCLPSPIHIRKAYAHAASISKAVERSSNVEFSKGSTSFRPKSPWAKTPTAKGTSGTGSPSNKTFRNASDFSKRRKNFNALALHDHAPSSLKSSELWPYLRKNVRDWIKMGALHDRLVQYGIPSEDLKPLLLAFADYLEANNIFTDLCYPEEHLRVIARDLADPEYNVSPDVQLNRLLYEWAAQTSTQATLEKILQPSTLLSINTLFHAADLSEPVNISESTRASPRRKVIMHVGPTNSGKTHNALRALAAAERGVYAGPLRLLAHEIWERLNNGQIVPLGMDAEAHSEADEDINLDATAPGDKPAVQKRANKKFARACNLVTGDERRIVDENAPLLSCTVEMMQNVAMYDVAVVDEIQLIADPERGGAWSFAVLGTPARELHLCGEETAVPLIQRLMEETGDEFIVNRYERLTPLRVAETSLQEDHSKVQKGDCYVTFSRSHIFKARTEIEEKSGLRCAVAYGKLPPEVRSQQAALFNDPDSGYDVLVGSDAVGMGLNLKIKRMIFEQTSKWNGKSEEPLSLSQIKQIAGRAGRYGLHGADSSGGVVTTMYEKDLPVVHAALAAPMDTLRKARIHPPHENFTAVVSALDPETPLSIVPWVFHYVGKHHPLFALQDAEKFSVILDNIDSAVKGLTVSKRSLFLLAPFRWRDPRALEAAQVMMRMYAERMRVDHAELLNTTGMMDTINEVRDMIAKDKTKFSGSIMQQLESLHGTLVTYLWLHFRLPVPFSDYEEVAEYKAEVEKAMQWCLERMSKRQGLQVESELPTSRSPLHPESSGGRKGAFKAKKIQRSSATERKKAHA